MKPESSATFISVLGVILTAASVIASVAQYRAADLQAKAAVVALMPQIEVRALLEKVDSDKYTDRHIEITSDGGPIYNFKLSRLSWIEFRVRDSIAYHQPFTGYYFSEYPTGHTKGALTTLKGYRNNEEFFQFLHWAKPALGGDVEILEPVTLLRMSYIDALKQENMYYVLVSGGNETHLAEDVGAKLWDTRSKMDESTQPVDISALKAESNITELVQLWKRKVAEAKK
ncbi:hypothetical protein [Methylomonas koyamae]|uniref:hypothetical protein n=1 Tax=Methylomonas koyamae TaxID=702114 RepID=UPI00112AB2D1|nr:hypothetical protein [Methylomonas koyamae]TPQ27961.1 hypothetical protein C2U68_06860 [Methylomonas koyamae]